MTNTLYRTDLLSHEAKIINLKTTYNEAAKLMDMRERLIEFEICCIEVNQRLIEVTGCNHEYQQAFLDKIEAEVETLESKTEGIRDFPSPDCYS